MNGYISARIMGEDGKDESTGIPIVGVPSWSEDSECRYKANTLNNKGRYVDGGFTQSEYEITTDDMFFRADFIRLKNSGGIVVCEKRVQSIEVLEDIQRVKITI